MKNSAFSLMVLASIFLASFTTYAASKTVLHVPLFVEITSGTQSHPSYKYVPVSEFNKILIQHGQKPQQAFVNLTLDSQFDFYGAREALDAAIIAAGIKNVQAIGEHVPGQWGDRKNYTCYRGNGRDVVDIVLNNLDSLYSDQYTLWAWKLGKTTTFVNVETDSSFESEGWNNYNEKSDSVLMLASVGDDGTDENASLIPRCK